MISLSRLAFFCISFLFTLSSFSQWTQTSGPEGGPTEEIYKVENSLILFTAFGGAYKSLDNGESWNPSNSGFPENPWIRDTFEENGTLYVSIEQNGIYISTDQGNSWASISSLQNEETVNYIFVDGNDIYGTLERGGISYSPDKGATWEFKTMNAPNFLIVNLHVYNSKLYSKQGNGFFVSDNKGDTWEEIIVPGISQNGINSITTHNDMLFISDGNNVFYSQDGLTWANSNAPSSGGRTQLQSYGGNLYHGMNQGEYYYLSNIGGSWTQVQNLSTTGFVYKLLFLDNSILMSTSDGVYKTVDNGVTWSEKNIGIRAQSSWSMAKNDSYVFAIGVESIYRTNDNGQNWTVVNNGFYRPLYQKSIPDLIVVDNTLFVSTTGAVYSSDDNGDSWVPKYLTSSFGKSTGILAHENNNIITAESFTGVLLSTDKGETWTLTETTGLNPSFQYTSMLIKGDTIVLGTYQGELFISTDLGQNWSDISIPGQFDNQRPIDIEYLNDRLYVASREGLWVSDDLGNQWEPFIENDSQYMWDVEVIDDAVYVATLNGVQVSTEGRSSWYPLTEGMGPKRTIKLLPNEDSIFAATQAYGIWVGPISELGVPPPDDDNDGVANEDDLCPNTESGVVVNATGCDLIAANAISVYASTPTCPNVNNGTIEIATSLTGYSFDVQIVGEGVDESFTAINLDANLKVDDLAPGTYEVTVSIPNIIHEQLFGITVNELNGISGKFQDIDVKSKSASYIVSGSTKYNVSINGAEKNYYFNSTNDNEIVLRNLRMSNEVIISGKNDCQGKIEETLSLEQKILMYPTITSGSLTMSGALEGSEIRVYNSSGRLVLSEKNSAGETSALNLDNYTTGLYIVHVLTEGHIKTFKIIKR